MSKAPRKVPLVEPDGSERDLWPDVPTREECVKAGYPTTFHEFSELEALWSALTIEEKEALGFRRVDRAMRIGRLIDAINKGKSRDR